MADASLDDFFAKKDKSKKKPKKQINDPESLVAGDSEAQKKIAKKKKDKAKKKEKENNVDEPNSEDGEKSKPEENEWADFEEEKEADLTGLRIAPLQVKQDKEDGDELSGNEHEEGEDGDNERKAKPQDGVWSKSADGCGSEAYQHHRAPSPEPEPAKPAVPVTGGKYVPPSRRAGGAATMEGSKANRKKKEAPNIKSEMDFPTLGMGKPGGPDGGGRFEEVERGSRGGGSRPSDDKNKSQALELGNKFGALSDNNY